MSGGNTHARSVSGSDSPRDFDVIAGSHFNLGWVLVPMLLVVGGTVTYMVTEPHKVSGWSWLHLAVLVLLTLGIVLGYFRRRVSIVGDTLVIRSSLFTRRTPITLLRLEQARTGPIRQDREFALKRKRIGWSMPGFHSGHFLLHGGRRGFCLITDVSRVLVIPAADGTVLLLSMEQPHLLLSALERVTGQARHR